MKEAPARKHDFLAEIADWESDRPSSATPWLAKLRREASTRFRTLGFPGPRDEEWRQTNLAAIAATPFERAAASAHAEADGARLEAASPWWKASASAQRLVFVNGTFSAAHSTVGRGASVAMHSLARTLVERPEQVQADLARDADWAERPFAALNTAWFHDGAHVVIPDGVILNQPLYVVHVTDPGPRPAATFPRVLVRLGRGCRAALVEVYVSTSDGVALADALTQVSVGEDSSLVHVRIQDESKAAFHVGLVQFRQDRDSRVHSLQVSFGAALARYDIGAALSGPGAECTLDGLYVISERQHVDHHTTIDHAAANCASHEMYKGVLAGAGRAVFNGRIIVRPGAQKTDAKQSNKNLLLSDEALVHTRPQLEIHADDVKCTHGATIGRLDPDALFYLRSRGVALHEARNLLIHAFTAAVLGPAIPGELRGHLDDELAKRLAAHAGLPS